MPSDRTITPAESATAGSAVNQAYPAGSMQVEEGATPDGRRLLYFTFPEPGQDQTLEAGGESAHGQTAPGQAAGA